MDNLIIPKTYDSKAILIADDEPEHIEFLIDYLIAGGFSVTISKNAEEAINACEKTRHRAYIIDLNIPLGGFNPAPDPSPAYKKYPGLHIIRTVRTQGNAGARVVAYSAHYNDEISGEIARLYCKYIIKGRAKELKETIAEIMASDPLQPKSPKYE
jgi:CheY-like chemotaxis protein